MLLITFIFYLICETGLIIAICKHVYTVYIGVYCWQLLSNRRGAATI
jgi:hypothetical protein